MNNKITMKDLKLVYDRENNKFIKAFVTINGEKQIITGDKEVRAINKSYAKERGTDDIQQIPDDYSLAYATNKKVIASFEEKYKDAKIIPIVLKKNDNPYNEQKIRDAKIHDRKVGVITGVVSIAAAGLAAAGILASAGKINLIPEGWLSKLEVQAKENTKKDPESWIQYEEEYTASKEKELLTGSMDDITNNIVDITVNKKDYKLVLAPKEIIALNYYYNTFEMENEEMLQTYGLYNYDAGDNGDLINNVHSALEKIRISLVKAEKIEDVITPTFTDPITQNLFKKYAELYVEYNTSKSKSSVKKETEEALKADFIENGSIDLNEHPSATVILQLIPSAFNLNISPLNSKLNVLLVGTETNVGVDGVKDTIQQNGLVDSSCSVIERRLEKFDSYREILLSKHEIDVKFNEKLLKESNESIFDKKNQKYYDEEYTESEFSALTKDTYDIKNVMIPLMNKELIMNFDLGDISISSTESDNEKLDELMDEIMEEINDEIVEEVIEEKQNQQLNNNKKWDLKTNPSGGKIGDTIRDETVRVEVTEQQLINSAVAPQEITEAKKEYQKKNPDIIDGTNKEEVKAADQQIKENLYPICKEAYQAGQSETINGGPNAPTNSKYANHESQVVRDYYYDGRNNGIPVWNEIQAAKNNPVVGIPSYEPEHKNNPNQNGYNNQTEDKPVIEQIETEKPKEETSTQPDQVEQPENDIPDHSSNPNQNGSNNQTEDKPVIEEIETEEPKEETSSVPEEIQSNQEDNKSITDDFDSSNTTYNIDTTDVIEGTITTDSTGVEDLSKYGEVQDVSVMSFRSEEPTSNESEDVKETSTDSNEVEEDTETASVEEEVSETSFTSESIEAAIDSYINEVLADQNSEINQEIESTYELVK